jgi:hypothetical protein
MKGDLRRGRFRGGFAALVRSLAPPLGALALSACAPFPPLVPAQRAEAPPAKGECPPPPPAEAPPPAGPPPYVQPSAGERAAILGDAVAAIRKYHVFSPHTEDALGARFDVDLPAVERAVAKAGDELSLLRAFELLGAILHNPHARFDARWPVDKAIYEAGFQLYAEQVGGAARFCVSLVQRADLGALVHPGDCVLARDGVPIVELSARLAACNHANNPVSAGADLSRCIVELTVPRDALPAGRASTWTFQPRGGGPPVEVSSKWSRKAPPRVPEDDYTAQGCLGLRAPSYGPYRLVSRGIGWCLYTSSSSRFDRYPIVRHASFWYGSSLDEVREHLTADWFHLRAELAALPAPKGVLLDVRENGGGNEPMQIASWYAPRPFPVPRAAMRLDRDLAPLLSEVTMRPPELSGLYPAWLAATPDAPFGPPLLFGCSEERCPGGLFSALHPVTRAPTALLTGPGCASACDGFAWLYDEGNWGPVVGATTAASTAPYRMRHPVKLPNGHVLGHLELVLARTTSGLSGEILEGHPLRVDVPLPEGFDARATYDERLVHAAIEALGKWPPAKPAPRP